MSATLASLRIRNLALVEELFWEPPGGFVAITGETGAGKSVILGAVKLVLGERADKSLVRAGADSCTVEGVFEIPKVSEIHGILEEGGAEACEEGRLIIKRTVAAGGNGKQFVNGSPTPRRRRINTSPNLYQVPAITAPQSLINSASILFSPDEK